MSGREKITIVTEFDIISHNRPNTKYSKCTSYRTSFHINNSS